MKITIDLEDFWMDEDSNGFNESFKSFIIDKVRHNLWQSIQKKVEEHCEVAIKKEIETSMYRQMNTYISDFIKVGEVKSFDDRNKTVTIEEAIKEKFMKDSGWNSAKDQITKLAQTLGNEMKQRYDLLFASQIVAKMKDNNFLTPEAATLLIETTK